MITQYIAIAACIVGLVLGWGPTYLWYEAKEDKRAKVEAEAAVEQEKKNVAIVTQYQDLLTGVSDWYRANPVRVRIQGGQTSPGCPAPALSDIVLTIPGYKRSDSTETVQ